MQELANAARAKKAQRKNRHIVTEAPSHPPEHGWDPPSEPPEDEDAAPRPELVVTCMSDVKPLRVSWLWEGYLPLGKLVVLDGDPSVGKSTLAVEFAAIVSTGGRWPDAKRCEWRGDVLILSAEDGLADTIRPRLDAAGADVTKVHAIQGVRLDDGTLMPPTLSDIVSLEEAIAKRNARLLIVDVLMAYIGTGADTHKDQDIRRVLSRLSALAERTDCTVLLLRHLNKGTASNPLYRGGGSIGIVGAARAGLLAAHDPDDDDRRVLASVKSNLAAAPASLSYQLVSSGHYGVARVAWGTETSHTAETLLSSTTDTGAAGEAKMWLEDFLMQEGGCTRSSEAKKAAAKVGISERTLQRAAKSLKLVMESKGFPRETFWSLPTRPASPATPPVAWRAGATGATGADLQGLKGGFGATGEADLQSRQSRQAFGTGATEARLCDSCAADLVIPESIIRGRCAECSLSANPEDV